MQDNAPAQTSQVATAAATKCNFEVAPHPQYSPEFSLSGLSFSKSDLHGRNFGSKGDNIDIVEGRRILFLKG